MPWQGWAALICFNKVNWFLCPLVPFASHPFSEHLPSRSPPTLLHPLLPLHSLHVRRARQHRCGRIDLPRTVWEHSYVRPHVFVYHTCAWPCIHGQIHDFDIQDSTRLQIKTTPDCLMFAFLRESDEAVLCVQSILTASVQKENHAHLSKGSISTVGSL